MEGVENQQMKENLKTVKRGFYICLCRLHNLIRIKGGNITDFVTFDNVPFNNWKTITDHKDQYLRALIFLKIAKTYTRLQMESYFHIHLEMTKASREGANGAYVRARMLVSAAYTAISRLVRSV